MKKRNFKLGLLISMLVLCFVICTGCDDTNINAENKHDNNSQDGSDISKEVDMKELKEEMLSADSSLPEMSVVYGSDENAASLFAYLAEYDYDNVADYFFAYAAAGTAEEVAVIKLKDEISASDCLKSVKKHVESRINQFQTYDPSQVKMCESALVFSNENFVVLIIAEGQTGIKNTFYGYFSGEKN